MIQTHHERRIALLEQNISELNALVCGYRLALDEAEKKIAELTRLHICEPPIPKYLSPAGAGERDVKEAPKRKK
jgi:hypothetical protein